MIPLIDLKAQHAELKTEINSAINEVISDASFIGGKKLKDFERNFSDYCGKKQCIGVSNGSTALYVLLKSLGIAKDDEVVMPVNTFIATANAVILCDAKPVFVDIGEDHLINPELIQQKITSRTKAIIPVHLYGHACNMEKINEIASKNNLLVIEDCAQSHGTEYNGKKVPVGRFGCFSFFPAKTLGTIGDGGAIVCDEEETAEKCRMLTNHGRTQKYLHEVFGFNFRLDTLKAAVLDVKLKHLDDFIERKTKIAELYDKEFSLILKTPPRKDNIKDSHYLYVIETEKRDKLAEKLKENNIETGIHYPIPLHLQPSLAYLKYKKGDFPVAERVAERILSLPMHPNLSQEIQMKIIGIVKEFLKDG
jgi:UDP-2-acetamido-2-deoxy-ribo-hexuluronate aminotransferase